MTVMGAPLETAAASDPWELLQPYYTDCPGVASDLHSSKPLEGFLRTQACIKMPFLIFDALQWNEMNIAESHSILRKE